MEADYLIIGQGIVGTLLSWNLLRRGKKVVVADFCQPDTATRIASGLINPFSGKRLVMPDNFESYLSFCDKTYGLLSEELNLSVMSTCGMLHFHENEQISESYAHRRQKWGGNYLKHVPGKAEWSAYFHFNNGISEIKCSLVDLAALLTAWRDKLQAGGLLMNEWFDWQACSISRDAVRYRDITAKKIISCEGIAGRQNPYFPGLPFTQNKGEVLLVSIPGLPRSYMYKKHGLHIIPWADDLFWIGSSFEREFTDLLPSVAFREQTEERLHYWLKMPYSIVGHHATLRPATPDRMPFALVHDTYPSLVMLNGMGAKGCMLAPFYTHNLAEHLVNGSGLSPGIDVSRFKKL